MSLQIAIVGSGPAGCFLAELLSRKLEDCRIDIIERQPALFGLVRAGVAPDHQGTKNVTRQFERTLQKDNIRILANLTIGSDIPYETLKATYDLVVLATGASEDRPLNIPGEDLQGVYGSGHFVGWYNAHPESHQQPPLLQGPSVAIIGHGNVALDIARVLAKTPQELADSDICEPALAAIQQQTVRDIYLIGRGSPEQARFTPPELAELKTLSQAVPVISDTRIPESPSETCDARTARGRQMNLDLFREFAANADTPASRDAGCRIHLLFGHTPEAISGDSKGRIQSLQFSNQPSRSANTLISAIGYRSRPIEGVPFDSDMGRIRHDQGLVEPGVYVTGWCRRGPTGVIPTNRADALELSKRILSDLKEGAIATGKPGREAMDQLIEEQKLQVLSYQDWQRIDQAETATAYNGKPREKFTSHEAMLALFN